MPDYEITERPTDEQIWWVIERLRQFVRDGGGTYRTMLSYLDDAEYSGTYSAGGLDISNMLNEGIWAI